jgi:hypothetical protein
MNVSENIESIDRLNVIVLICDSHACALHWLAKQPTTSMPPVLSSMSELVLCLTIRPNYGSYLNGRVL